MAVSEESSYLLGPPSWRARVSLLVWAITFELSGIGDPTSSKLPPA